jgi:hypothetical protein
MFKRVNIKIVTLLAIIIVLFLQNKAFGQQTLFNVPSADVTEKGKIFLQHETQFSNKFFVNTEYFGYGLGKNTELDITLGGVGTDNAANEILGAGFKSFIPIHKELYKKYETKLTFGTLIQTSLRGKGVGNWTYSHLSARLPKLKTRFSGGINVLTTTFCGRDVFGFIGGIEQPITKNFGLQMDWFSGKHSNGFLIPGFYYSLPKNITLWVGYQIHNNKANGDNGFVIELSRIF